MVTTPFMAIKIILLQCINDYDKTIWKLIKVINQTLKWKNALNKVISTSFVCFCFLEKLQRSSKFL